MRLFTCAHCGQPVYFDNHFCSSCNAVLGFDSLAFTMRSLKKNEDGTFTDYATGRNFHFCENHQYEVCNWVIPDEDPAQICIACSLNHVIPNLTNPEYRQRWQTIEQAKHRLVYSLLKWHLPVVSKDTDAENGIWFDFKSDDGQPAGQRVLTGHDNGLITMNIAEADDVEREMAKNNMDEVYRTVLGHFRHEIGHYYWDRLIAGNPTLLEKFRELFGDDRLDYQEALDKHYKEGTPANWNENFISAYATMHPWEDWAETWAHYLHIVDSLETAWSFGLSIHPRDCSPKTRMAASIDRDAYMEKDFEWIFDNWLPVTFALNSINRSMGEDDLYPFVITVPVKEKLKFIHEVIHGIS